MEPVIVKRHYAQPANGVHAIQMELAQSTYLQTQDLPFHFHTQKAERLRTVLRTILQNLQSSLADSSS